MSTEPEPNQSATPATGAGETPKNQDAAAKDAAAKALGQAKEKMTEGMAAFKKLDVQAQVYLAGLAVTTLCSLLFSFYSISLKVAGPGAEFAKEMMKSMPRVTVFDAGANGKLAVLFAIAGIGLWIWNFTAKKKEAWAPLALAGCAGGSALLFLILWLRMGSFSSGGFGADVSMGTTLLGFWLPFAGAIAAAVVSVKRILNPAPAPAA